jgi:hypothetical protein
MKKTIQFVVIGTVLALTAPAYADTLTNKLASNKLAVNKLASNKLAVNGIIANGIRSKDLGVAAAAGEGAVDDIVGVKLPDGTTFIR